MAEARRLIFFDNRIIAPEIERAAPHLEMASYLKAA
jgi:hypothetical protein